MAALSEDNQQLMDLRTVIASVKTQIGEGNIESALNALITLLDSDAKYTELAQIARVNQGDLYQVKASSLKNTISNDDARRINNQVADNTLQIVQRLEAGKITFEDPRPSITPTRSQAWRYYAAGGIVTLAVALLVWRFYSNNNSTTNTINSGQDCPTYGNDILYKVMVLPFYQTGTKKGSAPEIDIAEGLNKFIDKAGNLKASADVKKSVATSPDDYMQPAEAATIATACGVQMIVWGKINQSDDEGYKLDVRYKLLNEGGVVATGDTSLSNLLTLKDQGSHLANDAESIAKYLYFVLANRAHVSIAANLMPSSEVGINTKIQGAAAVLDSSEIDLHIAYAVNLANNGQQKAALNEYEKILAQHPNHQETLEKRGGLLYKMGQYSAAARELQRAAPDPGKANSDLLKVRADANIKSGLLQEANEDINALKKKKGADRTWIDRKGKEASDSLAAVEKRLVEQERIAATQKPISSKTRVGAAKDNISAGHPDKAIAQAKAVVESEPKNLEAIQVAVDAFLQKGDSVGARKFTREAEKRGANVKDIFFRPMPVRPLSLPKKRQ